MNSWIKIRKIRKRNFIAFSSLLFGLLIAIFSSFIKMIIDNRFEFNVLYSSGFLGMLIGGTLGGMLFSFSLWELNENKYKKQN
jgi:hypothetical protein